MSKASKETGSAAARGPEKFTAHAQELIGEVDELAESLGDTVHDVQAVLDEQAEHRPYVLMAAAATVGFVLGGGLTVRVGRMLMGYGGKTAARLLFKRLTQAI